MRWMPKSTATFPVSSRLCNTHESPARPQKATVHLLSLSTTHKDPQIGVLACPWSGGRTCTCNQPTTPLPPCAEMASLAPPPPPLSPLVDSAVTRSAASTAGTGGTASDGGGGGLRRAPSRISSAGGSATLVPIEESLPRLDPFSDWQITPEGEVKGMREGALCLSGEVGSGKACCVTELCILARQHAARVEQTTPDQHICFSLTPTGQLLPPCAEIEICKRPDGSDWELGSGGFGKVGSAANVSQNCFCDLQRPQCGCDSGHSRTSAARSAAPCETVMMSPCGRPLVCRSTRRCATGRSRWRSRCSR